MRFIQQSRQLWRVLAFVPVFLFAVGSLSIHAQSDDDAGYVKVASVEGITEYRLDNGLRVLLFPDSSAERTSVVITYFVGSRHEAYGETGMAHLLEHLVFKGTPNHPDISAELTERGASPNGTTWLDRTNYFETFAATDDNLEWALDLESDRMINSFIAKEDLDSEMTVVRNEWESGENNPGRVLGQRLRSAAFMWHNYGNTTIGARSDIENVPIDRLKAFYKKYYQPDNAQLMIAGKFNVDRALELVVEKFGPIPRPERTGANQLFETYTSEPAQDGERVVTLRRVGDVQLVQMGFHIPAGVSEEYAAADVLAFVLGSGPSSRLYKNLVETQLATGAYAYAEQFKEPGLMIFGATVPKGQSMEEAEAAIHETIAFAIENPPTQEEVDRAKTTYLNGIERAMRNPIGIAQQMSEWGAMGDWRLMFLYRDNLEKVTVEDVHNAAVEYLKPSNRTTAYFIPVDETPPRVQIPEMPDIAAMVDGYEGREAVSEGEQFDPSLANIQARTQFTELSNGAKVALLPKENRGDTVILNISLRWGSESEMMDKGYIASMASSMPMRGTVDMTRAEIVDEFTRIKTTGGVSAGLTGGSISINTDRANLTEAVQLVGKIATQPAWDQAEFDLIKKSQITSLEASQKEPQALASIAMGRHLSQWPKGHPFYVSTIQEDIEGFESVTLEQAKEFYNQYAGLGPSATVVAVGDFDPDEMMALLEDNLGDWNPTTSFERIASDAQGQEAMSQSIETPDKTNAVFYAGFDFPLKDTHPDYEALVIANYIMGGGFLNSRLAVRIRQKDGLSYGVRAGFSAHPIDARARFNAYAIAAPENVDKVIGAFTEEVQKAIDLGFSEEEVDAAKTGWLDSRKRSRASDGTIAGLLNTGLYFERDMSFFQEREDKIAALTAEEVSAVFAKYYSVDKITIVTAGDFARVAAEAEAEESGE